MGWWQGAVKLVGVVSSGQLLIWQAYLVEQAFLGLYFRKMPPCSPNLEFLYEVSNCCSSFQLSRTHEIEYSFFLLGFEKMHWRRRLEQYRHGLSPEHFTFFSLQI
jgi:hypothetical protein